VVALPVAAVLAFVPAAAGAPHANRIAVSAVPWAVVGTHVGVRGTVTPHPAGLQVSLQQRQGSGWLTVGAAPVRGDGSFRLVASPARVGIATFRVVGANFTGKSARVPVRVLHWVYVESVPGFAYTPPISGEVTSEPIATAGVRYQHPLSMDAGCYNQWGGDAWVDYDLERQNHILSTGLLLLRYTLARLREDPSGVTDEIWESLVERRGLGAIFGPTPTFPDLKGP